MSNAELTKLKNRIRVIGNTDYDCEDPFSRKQSPAIGLAIRRFLAKQLTSISQEGESFEIISDSRGYGDYSCFVRDTNCSAAGCIYVVVHFASCRRLLNDMGLNSVLYRAAKDDHDYSGGSNRYSSMEDLAKNIRILYNNTVRPTAPKPISIDIFDMKSVKDRDAMVIEIIHGYQQNEVCLGEYLDSVIIENASVNDVAYIFAKLHNRIEDDQVVITIEDEKKDLVDYL